MQVILEAAKTDASTGAGVGGVLLVGVCRALY